MTRTITKKKTLDGTQPFKRFADMYYNTVTKKLKKKKEIKKFYKKVEIKKVPMDIKLTLVHPTPEIKELFGENILKKFTEEVL